MTEDELKVKIRKVFEDNSLNKEERTKLLSQLFIEFVPEDIRMDSRQTRAMQNFGETWNDCILEVVRGLPDTRFK